MNITPHLTTNEITCKCGCGFGTHEGDFSQDTAELFETIREEIGKPIIVSSGCRCEKHNKAIGGSSNSQHCKGTALDLICPQEVDYDDFYAVCIRKNNKGGVGYYPGDNIVHIDTRGKKARW